MAKSTKNVLIKTNATNVQDVLAKANALCAQRENFEREELARTNKALYAILSEVYALFKRTIDEKCVKETVIEMRDSLKKRGVKVQSNTPALTVFVRYVFNSDRKRAYNYASTLMAAVQANVDPSRLADFIESKNGVEECKKEFKKSDAALAREEAIAIATTEVADILSTMQCKATVKLESESVDLSDSAANLVFIVARKNADTKYDLLRIVPKTTKAMEKYAIKELAKQLVEAKEQALKNAKSAKVKEATKKASNAMTSKNVAKMTVEELTAA